MPNIVITVTDAKTGKPLQGVYCVVNMRMLWSDWKEQGAGLTDANGVFKLTALEFWATYNFSFSLDGYWNYQFQHTLGILFYDVTFNVALVPSTIAQPSAPAPVTTLTSIATAFTNMLPLVAIIAVVVILGPSIAGIIPKRK